MESNLIDFFTLTLYALYFGAMLGGAFLLIRFTGRKRLAGLVLAAEGAAAGSLLAIMGSKYCFTRPVCIDVRQTELLVATSKVILATLAGGLVCVAVSFWFLRSDAGQLPILKLVVFALAVPLVALGGSSLLVNLSQPREQPVIDPEQRVLKVLPGFSVSLVIKSLHNPTSLTFGPDGKLYGCDLTGEVWMANVNSGTGQVHAPDIFAKGFDKPVGLVWLGNRLYVSSLGKISYLQDLNADGQADSTTDIVTGLPVRLYDDHQNNGLAVGSDGHLYFGVGSTSNSQPETHANAASILRVSPDGSNLEVFATGIRNAYDLAFNSHNDLFATDNGPAGFEPTPGDELNYIVQGGNYGFPKYYEYPPLDSHTLGPVIVFPAHASPDGITFYTGHQFPAEYRDNAFVATFARGEIYRVQLLKTSSGSYTGQAEVFASGFLNSLDVTTGPDGNLYVADFGTGAIYRIAYSGTH